MAKFSAEVAVSFGHNGYPSGYDYSPSVLYPEYPFGPGALAQDVNHAYEGVREALQLSGLDAAHLNGKDWNPLGEMIHPGDKVVLKPNLVRDFRETQPGHGNCLITHGSIIRATLDYVYIALKGEGQIIIADAPHSDADFDALRRIAGLDEIQEFYKRYANFDVDVRDLRPEKARKIQGVIVDHERLPGDPAGYVKVDLGRHSMFHEISRFCPLLYGSEYDTAELQSHHHGDTHEYLISGTILRADCVINLPKLKTHKKTGITICMKNLVGINGNKNWLPHHRLGTPAQGGDQFADEGVKHRVERRVMAGFRKVFPRLGPMRGILAGPLKAVGRGMFGDTNAGVIRSGNWYGNDTTWRMAMDLSRILIYASPQGHLQDTPARRVFCIVDGVVGGEGNGPLDPTPKEAGVVLAGVNPVAVDLACARLMGFDPQRLPLLQQAFRAHALPIVTFELDEVVCRTAETKSGRPLTDPHGESLHFRPHFGWQGHVELAEYDESVKPRP